MNNSTETLPEGYVLSGEINLKKNKKLALLLNVAALFIGVPSFILLSAFAASIRPGLMDVSGSFSMPVMTVIILVLVFGFMTIHELIHGFFFWLYTRSRPVFALRLFYAYAGAPDWYIPVRQFMVVALAPLIVIGVAGTLLMLLVPESWVVFVAFLVALNTGGSIGDLMVFSRLLKTAPTSLANDTGDVFTFYEQSSA